MAKLFIYLRTVENIVSVMEKLLIYLRTVENIVSDLLIIVITSD